PKAATSAICNTPAGRRQRKMAIAFAGDISHLRRHGRAPPHMAATLTLLPALALVLQPQAGEGEPPSRPEVAVPEPDAAPPPVDDESIEGRRRPGYTGPLPEEVTQTNPGAVRAPPPEAFPTDQIPIPDRWRLIQSLGLVTEHWYDPYHQNTLKGDRPIDRAKVPWLPIKGDDWFFTLSGVSDSVL